MKRLVKTIGVLSVASLMSTSAFSQISVSGYAEVGFMTGSTNGTRSTASGKTLGGESVITVAGKGSLNNGWTYSAYQNIDSDEGKFIIDKSYTKILDKIDELLS